MTVRILPRGFVTLQDSMGDDLSVIRAARVSYGKEANEVFDVEKDGKLLKYLLKNSHWSPFEHTSLTFHVKAPIFVARQWFRHKSWSFNEISGRYRELETDFYRPPTWRGQSKVNKQASEGAIPAAAQESADYFYEQSLRNAVIGYNTLLDMGVARELARMVLPVSLYTEFYATANLRSVLHFLDQRLDSHAQLEIQEYASDIAAITRRVFPHTLEAWEKLKEER